MARRISDVVKHAIWQKYAPRIDGEIDPMCLYVGPLMDGMGQFMPELGDMLMRSSRDERNDAAIRTRIKHFIKDLVNPRTGTRAGSAGGDVAGTGFGTLVFQRRGGNPVELTRRTLLEQEPGEYMNSVEVVTDSKGKDLIVNVVREPGSYKIIDPLIREDNQHFLHYLMVGDKFKANFTSRGRTRMIEYDLRPVSEGSSVVSAPASIGERQEIF